MKSNLRILLFLTFACWCVDATNLNTIFEISDTYQSTTSDTAEDEKLKDFESKYNSKLNYMVFIPVIIELVKSNYGIFILYFYPICLEVNAPPPDALA